MALPILSSDSGLRGVFCPHPLQAERRTINLGHGQFRLVGCYRLRQVRTFWAWAGFR